MSPTATTTFVLSDGARVGDGEVEPVVEGVTGLGDGVGWGAL
jgi:hypothetical protein